MEKIDLHLTRSLVPPVFYRLATIKEGQLSYNYYGLRHPGGTFSIQLSDVLTAFNQLVQAVNNIQATGIPCSNDDTENLKNRTRTMFFQLANYFESGYEIFLCFCDRLDKPLSGNALYRWFEANGYGKEVKPYFVSVNPTLSKYRDFFNALKHSSNRIRTFQFLSRQESRKAIGFYLEGVVDETGAIGPVLTLHPKFRGVSTAWSYNLHLRNLYFAIYQIGFEMEAAIQRLCERHGICLELPAAPVADIGLEQLAATALSTARRFETVFNVCYPQEATERIKNPSLDEINGSLIFTEDIVGTRAIGPGQAWEVTMTSRGDGFSRTFQLPYYNPATMPR